MSKLKYHQAFTRLTTLSLLHLYCYMDVSSRFVPITKRNELLITFLKIHITLPDNILIKKDIKTLIMVARKGKDLEGKLWELHKVNNQYGDKFTDADHLFILLTYLYEEHGFPSSILDNSECEREKGVIYAERELIDSFFNEENILTQPLPLSIIMDEPNLLVALINARGGVFIAEHISTSVSNQCATLLLNKTECFLVN